MLGKHSFVAAELVGVVRWTPEDLTPPGDHMQAVLLPDPAREHRRQQLVGFDPVIEGIDEPRKRCLASSPVVERGHGAILARTTPPAVVTAARSPKPSPSAT